MSALPRFGRSTTLAGALETTRAPRQSENSKRCQFSCKKVLTWTTRLQRTAHVIVDNVKLYFNTVSPHPCLCPEDSLQDNFLCKWRPNIWYGTRPPWLAMSAEQWVCCLAFHSSTWSAGWKKLSGIGCQDWKACAEKVRTLALKLLQDVLLCLIQPWPHILLVNNNYWCAISCLCRSGKCQVVFQYRFTTPAMSVPREGQPTGQLFTEVETEYLVWNETALIGNVGGALGLLFGFSFLNLISWISEIIRNWLPRLKRCAEKVRTQVLCLRRNANHALHLLTSSWLHECECKKGRVK